MLIAPETEMFSGRSMPADPGRKILREIEDAFQSQKASRTDIEGQWVSDEQFLRGKQYQNWESQLGKIVSIQAPSARTVRMVWNITRRIMEDMKASLLQNAPRLNVVPMTGEWDAVQASRYGDDILKWKEVHDGWRRLRSTLMNWMVSTGNAFLWYEWDADSGPELDLGTLGLAGQSVRTGASRVKATSPLEVYVHPHATCLDESPYVMRRFAMSRQYAMREWAKGDPSLAKEIQRMSSINSDDLFWQTALLDTTSQSRYQVRGSMLQEVPDEQGFIQGVEIRWVPDDQYPNGFVAKALGDVDSMRVLVDVKPNPYTWEGDGEVRGGHGCVHFGAIKQSGAFWYDSWLTALRSPNVELNRRQSQMVEHANKAAAGTFIYPSDFAPFKHNLSNDPGRTYQGNPNATWLPQWVNPPNMPSYVVQAVERTLQLAHFIVAPFGDPQRTQDATSGVQVALLQQEQQMKAGPMVDEWEQSWEEYANLELRMWQRHQTFPREISVPQATPGGRSTQWRREYYSGSDLNSDIRVMVDPGSALPTSAIATLAFYAEGAKSGMLNPMNPVIQRRFYQDMKWGDALGTMDDMRADYERAEQNIHACQDPMLPQPLINPQVDDLQVHETVYRNFQKSNLFREWDPNAQMRLMTLHQMTLVFIQRQMASMLMMQAALAGGGGGGEGGASGGSKHPQTASTQAISAEDPMGGVQSMLQGFGEATNPNSGGSHAAPGSGE